MALHTGKKSESQVTVHSVKASMIKSHAVVSDEKLEYIVSVHTI